MRRRWRFTEEEYGLWRSERELIGKWAMHRLDGLRRGA